MEALVRPLLEGVPGQHMGMHDVLNWRACPCNMSCQFACSRLLHRNHMHAPPGCRLLAGCANLLCRSCLLLSLSLLLNT